MTPFSPPQLFPFVVIFIKKKKNLILKKSFTQSCHNKHPSNSSDLTQQKLSSHSCQDHFRSRWFPKEAVHHTLAQPLRWPSTMTNHHWPPSAHSSTDATWGLELMEGEHWCSQVMLPPRGNTLTVTQSLLATESHRAMPIFKKTKKYNPSVWTKENRNQMSAKQEYLPQTLKKERFERQHDLRSNKSRS